MSVLDKPLLTIFQILLSLHNTCGFLSSKNNTIRKSNISITSRFVPANDCVLFVLVFLAFEALHSGTVWLDGYSPVFVFGVVN